MTLPPLARASEELDPEGELSRILFGTEPQDTLDFISRFLTIPSERGAIVRFEPFPQQIKMAHDEMGRDITVKGRQTRASSFKIASRFRRMVFQRYGSNAMIAAQDDQTTALFRNQILHHIQDLRNAGWDIELGAKNADEIVIASRENRFEFVSGSQPTMGRAFARQEIHLSELAHWPESSIKKLLGGLMPSVPPAPYGMIDIESTPNGEEGSFFDYAMAAWEDPTDEFKVHFYPWWVEPRYRISANPYELCDIIVSDSLLKELKKDFVPTDEENRLMELYQLDINQILWRRMKKKAQDKTDAPFIQEYPEEFLKCWIGSSGRYFDTADGEDHLEYYRDNERPPIKTFDRLSYDGNEISFYGPNLLVWEVPIPGDAYVVAFDAAGGGIGKDYDYTSIGVWNATKSRRVARCMVQCTPKQAGAMMCAIGAFFNTALASGERTHQGQVVFDEMIDLGYNNIFYYVDPEKPQGKDKRMLPGIYPSPPMRERILEEFKKGITYHEVQTFDPVLNQQMSMFSWQKQGDRLKAQAEKKAGAHDDVVIEAAQGWFACKFARMRRQAKQRREERKEIVIGPNGLVQERRDPGSENKHWLF